MAFKQDYVFLSGTYNGIGFGNFVTILSDPKFLDALKNTSIMVFISVPLTIILSLLLAVALNSVKKLRGFFQTVFFLPYVTNTIALGLVFNVVFHKDYGLFNSVFGLELVDWLGSGTTYWRAMFVLMVYTIWNGLAFKIIVLLSGLQSIDKQYYQAASVDGANRKRVFGKITVPLLSPMILYVTITSFIGAFKVYTSVIALFGKGAGQTGAYGPDNMLITVVGYIYEKLWASGTPFGVAAAGSIILFIIILLITLVQFWISKKRVHY
jgi:multiple sugar transport system permease protein